ncbi:hypothetical protein AB1N83_010394 [Pleurotus pulmonarius]
MEPERAFEHPVPAPPNHHYLTNMSTRSESGILGTSSALTACAEIKCWAMNWDVAHAFVMPSSPHQPHGSIPTLSPEDSCMVTSKMEDTAADLLTRNRPSLAFKAGYITKNPGTLTT